MLLLQPGAQFGNRGVGPFRDTGSQHIIIRLQARPNVIVLRAWCPLARLAQPCPHLRDIRRAHLEPCRNRPDRLLRRRQYPVPQISTVSLTSPPAHHPLRNMPGQT